jgi:hypothetical protein
VEKTARQGEPRWPMALAVVTIAVLNVILPPNFRLTSRWALPVVLALLLGILIVGDPGRIDRPRRSLRIVMEGMVAITVASNMVATVRLVRDIIGKSPFSATQLLLIGGVVWLTNVLIFALWLWDLEGGGAAERATNPHTRVAFVFPEMSHPQYVGPDWAPRFIDYLVLSFNNATAFSPTDISAIRPWAKMLTVLEALVSLLLALLVIARAVNILT